MKNSLSANSVLKQIVSLTEKLISTGLCSAQSFPVIKKDRGIEKVTIDKGVSNIIMKNIQYQDAYKEMKDSKSYNFLLIDEALILMQYEFEKNSLKKARLLYLPNPYVADFQSHEDAFFDDELELYADLLDKCIVPFPIRFDYDPDNHIEIEHPSSHLTLGQYKNCRIPVSAPITPTYFIDFIIRNFYNTAHHKYAQKIIKYDECFEDTIMNSEKQILHMNLKV